MSTMQGYAYYSPSDICMLTPQPSSSFIIRTCIDNLYLLVTTVRTRWAVHRPHFKARATPEKNGPNAGRACAAASCIMRGSRGETSSRCLSLQHGQYMTAIHTLLSSSLVTRRHAARYEAAISMCSQVA